MVFFWFRRDLRLDDNAGLYYALRDNRQVQLLFIFDTHILNCLQSRDDRRVDFIHQALEKIKTELRQLGSDLLVMYGSPLKIWQSLIQTYPVEKVYANHDYEPYAIERDRKVHLFLKDHGVGFLTFKDQCIFEKNEIIKSDGNPYTVFTPYSVKWKEQCRPFYYQSYPTRKYFSSLIKHASPLPFPSLEEIGFQKTDIIFKEVPHPDRSVLRDYSKHRDFPALQGTSGLSVHFRFGTVSIRKMVRMAMEEKSDAWLNELIWRDFFMMLLFHFPYTVERAFRKEMDWIPWENNPESFEKWKSGRTGYPLVDAGMRELLHTGFMHNRVRMVVASFLTKNLLIDWRWGEAWFAMLLNDYDLSANVGNWQWAASTGCDSVPYFRIFNPVEQQKKFDPDFIYIKKWIPEFGTPEYPQPVVDLKLSRLRALQTYAKVIKKRSYLVKQNNTLFRYE